MNINLPKLSNMQRDLDTYIEEQHPVKQGENRFTKKCNALQRELGEFMEETKSFKYWSNKRPAEKHIVLEEFVDGLHFLVSIGNDKNVDFENLTMPHIQTEDVNELFAHLFVNASLLRFGISVYSTVVALLMELGGKCGFTAEDIEQAYIAKWEKNKARQDSGVY